MSTAYLALGSNLGDRQGYIHKALQLLEGRGVHIKKSSSFIETEPVGGPRQGKFFNVVVEVQTTLIPQELHQLTQSVEAMLGRKKDVPNGPRVIDIDILLYDDLKLISKKLIIPHPRMFDRPFVMDPLKEINPALCA